MSDESVVQIGKWVLVALVLGVLIWLAIYSSTNAAKGKFYAKCANINGSGVDFSLLSTEIEGKCGIITGFVTLDSISDGGPTVTFVIPNFKELGDNLKVSYSSGQGYLHDTYNHIIYDAEENIIAR